MTKYIFFLFCFLFSLSASATDIETNKALVRSVDKITGRTKTTTLIQGVENKIGNLKITLDRCLKKPPEEMPENKAFLRITEESGTPVFTGWMFSSQPALSAMEHPIYDIWVLECLSDPPPAPIIPTAGLSAPAVQTQELDDLSATKPTP